jgi:aminopeptidase-like protein
MYSEINNKKKIIKDLKEIFDKLWPINRSITGNGVRETHKVLSSVCNLKTFEFPSGKKIFDWTVPDEWNPRSAFILNSKGEKIIDFKKNNLHLLNYSTSYVGLINFKNLKKHLIHDKKNPTAIPYKTSYYKKQWGFCISYNNFKKLKNENYFVHIDTIIKKGSLTLSEYYLPGKTKKEILIHSYTCHPSMAVNELSGPITAIFLAKKLTIKKNRYFSYRFVFTAETVGTIAFLNKRGSYLKKNLVAGYILTCLGIKDHFTYKRSKQKISLADLAAEKTFKFTKLKNKKILDFSPSGSDERQYCSIGFNLPVGALMSKKCGNYKEYHSSLDNKSILDFNSLEKTIEILENIFINIENFYKNKVNNFALKNFCQLKIKDKHKQILPLVKITKCEPHLSKWNIHYKTKDYKFADKKTEAIKWLVHFSDGKNSLKYISKISNLKISLLKKVLKTLIKSKLFKIVK